jgi:hypothetical protein
MHPITVSKRVETFLRRRASYHHEVASRYDRLISLLCGGREWRNAEAPINSQVPPSLVTSSQKRGSVPSLYWRVALTLPFLSRAGRITMSTSRPSRVNMRTSRSTAKPRSLPVTTKRDLRRGVAHDVRGVSLRQLLVVEYGRDFFGEDGLRDHGVGDIARAERSASGRGRLG